MLQVFSRCVSPRKEQRHPESASRVFPLTKTLFYTSLIEPLQSNYLGTFDTLRVGNMEGN
jgi:hypothetical protein